MSCMYRIERYGTVTSTNELVKRELEQGSDEGLVCRATEQLGGYGRQGRTWSSPRGGLYQSILLRPAVPTEQLPTLGLVVALSVRRALLGAGALMSDTVQVKWPNDVVCGAGKLAGISVESHGGGVCVGIGINVWRPADERPIEGKNTPAYLTELARNGLECEQDTQMVVDFVGDEVMDVFWRRYAQWQREGFAPFVDEFNACGALNGKHVDIADRNGTVMKSGIVTGVNVDGSLLIGDDSVSSGEAHVL